MHSRFWTGLALLGLVLAAAPATWAQPPSSYMMTQAKRDSSHHHSSETRWHRHNKPSGAAVCPKCLKMAQESNGAIPPPPTVISSGPPVVSAGSDCPACEAAAAGTAMYPARLPDGTVIGAPVYGPPIVMDGSAPGYAVAGGPGQLPLMAGNSAPGYAVAGGMGPNSEPAPIGVVQAGYRPQLPPGPVPSPAASAAAGTAIDPLHGPPGGRAAMNSMFSPAMSRPRHHILARVLGLPDFGRFRAEREARARDAHAAIPMGTDSSGLSDLPASMVYGGSH